MLFFTESKIVIMDKDSYYGCRYIELNDDNTIHTDWGGRPIVSNAAYVGNIREGFDDFDNVETWLTEDVFNRIKYADGNDTFSDVVDMIANGEHKEFEAYIRESEIEMMCEEYSFDEDDAKDIIKYSYDDDYFDISIISHVWNNAYDIAENYIDECCNIESWLTNYIDYDGLGEAIINDGWYYELYDGRVVQYNY